MMRDFPMQMKRRGVEMRLVIGDTGPAKVDQPLMKTIINVHKWFNELASGKTKSIREIALHEGVANSYVSRVINLAFLAPEITEAIVAGRQPAGFTVEKLTKSLDLSLDWA